MKRQRKEKKGKKVCGSRGAYVEGVIERRGVKSFLHPADGGGEIFIPERKTNHACAGDKVRAYIYACRPDMPLEGEVVDVIQRAQNHYVGRMETIRGGGFVVMQNAVMSTDIHVDAENMNGAKDGDKVVVQLIDWARHAHSPEGKVIEVLGQQGENETEMHAILAEFGLPYSYPKEVEAAADAIADGITEKEVRKRKDMRDVVTFTIDPATAKDFDDALSIRRLANGHTEVGVHIADVTFYVRPGSIIDKEGYERGTSVYLVDRTIPMLPERLSNELCSLRPDEDKLCYSVIFELDENAKVIDKEITRTIIRSNRRFTYEEAQHRIETGEGDFADELLELNKLAKILRDKRIAWGALCFERDEVGFELDEKGKPLRVIFKTPMDANHLIEEFMLLANRTVAEFIGKGERKPKTFVYRVHDLPDEEKIGKLQKFVKTFGYKFKVVSNMEKMTKEMNTLLSLAHDRPEGNMIEMLAVKCMAKAEYSTENIGHYGLAFRYYTHFTSPIRRYPDMMVHRLLTRYLDGGNSVQQMEYEDYCGHCSSREQLAEKAERASIKYKQAEYLSDKIGQEFEGSISSVQEWGVYVELKENRCEGMIPMRLLSDEEYFQFDEANYQVVGTHSGKRYRIGDDIKVRVKGIDLEKKQIDFELVQ